MFLLNVCILYSSCVICSCDMYIHSTVAEVYAVVRFMYTVR